MARVHGGLRCVDKREWRHLAGARARQCSPKAAEEDKPDEAMPEGCSPEHEWWWRGRATEVKIGGSLSLARGRRKA
jgi:hypothetical protein